MTDTIDPAAAAILDEIEAAGRNEPEPRTQAEKLAKARRDAASLQRFSAPFPPGVERSGITIPASAAAPAIPVRLYQPQTADRPRLLVWFHGGGAIAGSLDTHEPVLAELARRTGRLVASVGYRLAPEAPYPAQHEDCLAAARHLIAGCEEIGADSRAPAIGGDSIGGLYAVYAGRRLREAPRAPAGLVLLYPNTDMRQDKTYPSLRENDGRIMTRNSLRFEVETSIPDPHDRAGPDASPVVADDLAGVPPVYLATCGADPLRDEGQALAHRLEGAGVPVAHRRFPGMIHAFLQMNGRIPEAGTLMDDVADFLRDA